MHTLEKKPVCTMHTLYLEVDGSMYTTVVEVTCWAQTHSSSQAEYSMPLRAAVARLPGMNRSFASPPVPAVTAATTMSAVALAGDWTSRPVQAYRYFESCAHAHE